MSLKNAALLFLVFVLVLLLILNYFIWFLKFFKFKQIANIRNIKVELLVVKKLPVDLIGKNSKNSNKKKTIDINLIFLFWV